jgi:hypothetical protein
MSAELLLIILIEVSRRLIRALQRSAVILPSDTRRPPSYFLWSSHNLIRRYAMHEAERMC